MARGPPRAFRSSTTPNPKPQTPDPGPQTPTHASQTQTRPELPQRPQPSSASPTSLGDLSGRTVVEIGPGAGAITQLSPPAPPIVAVELDPGLAVHLRSDFPAESLTVLNQDVLAFDFAAAAAEAGQPLLVFGNLPYYITSQILLKLAASHASIDRAALMVQREVADRITAQPGSRDYGVLSVTVQLYGPAISLFTLRPRPSRRRPTSTPPSSAGALLPASPNSISTRLPFLPFLRAVFAQKRKTLSNNLRAAGHSPPPSPLLSHRASIPPSLRAEELSLESLASLFHALELIS